MRVLERVRTYVQADGLSLRLHRLPVAGPGARGGGARGRVRAPLQVGRGRGRHPRREGQARQGSQRRLQPGHGPAVI